MTGSDNAGGEAGSARRSKRRGSGGHNKSQEGAIPWHLHLMYQEDDDGVSNGEREEDSLATDNMLHSLHQSILRLCQDSAYEPR